MTTIHLDRAFEHLKKTAGYVCDGDVPESVSLT